MAYDQLTSDLYDIIEEIEVLDFEKVLLEETIEALKSEVHRLHREQQLQKATIRAADKYISLVDSGAKLSPQGMLGAALENYRHLWREFNQINRFERK